MTFRKESRTRSCPRDALRLNVKQKSDYILIALVSAQVESLRVLRLSRTLLDFCHDQS